MPKAKFKGVELVRSPMRADDSSARFISMSLKTSKYSLGGALCCGRVQPQTAIGSRGAAHASAAPHLAVGVDVIGRIKNWMRFASVIA